MVKCKISNAEHVRHPKTDLHAWWWRFLKKFPYALTGLARHPFWIHTHTHAHSCRLSSASLIKQRYSNRPSRRGEIMKCDFTLQLRLIFLTAWLGLTGEYSREDTLPQQKLHPLISRRETSKDREWEMGRETTSWSTLTAKTPKGRMHHWANKRMM